MSQVYHLQCPTCFTRWDIAGVQLFSPQWLHCPQCHKIELPVEPPTFEPVAAAATPATPTMKPRRKRSKKQPITKRDNPRAAQAQASQAEVITA